MDRKELGKILVIASTAVLVVSIPAALSFQEAADSTGALNDQFEELYAVIGSQSFQESLDSLSTVSGGLEGAGAETQFTRAVETMQTVNSTVNRLEESEESLDTSASLYRWLVLLAVVGEVAGGAAFYI